MEFYLAGEITQVIDSIPWVRCASGNVSALFTTFEQEYFEEKAFREMNPVYFISSVPPDAF